MRPAKLRSSGDLIADRRYTFAETLIKERDWEAAADLLDQIVALVPHWAPGWFSLGEARHALGEEEAARAAFATALRLAPEDELGAGVRLARLGAVPAGAAMSGDYVRALFDDYADRFDRHLVEALAYRGPDLVLEALHETCAVTGRPPHFRLALDLGCGTGLMGEAVRPYVQTLAGCDIAPLMVAQARRRGCYDRLAVAELTQFLDGEAAESADLVLAADVFVYVGDLAPVFAATARALGEGGLFIFTAQSVSEAALGFILGEDMRFAHSDAHLKALAAEAGLDMLALTPAVTRHDGGRPVAGVVAVARKPAAMR